MEWRSIKDSLEGKCIEDSICVSGRLKKVRKHKDRLFVYLVDYSSQIQLVIERSKVPQAYHAVYRLGKGAYIRVSGVLERDNKENPEIRVGDLEIIANSF